MHVSLDVGQTTLTAETTRVLLEQAPQAQVPDLVSDVLERAPTCDRALIETIVSCVEARGLLDAAEIERALGDGSGWRQTRSGLWLSARLCELRDDAEGALVAWDGVLQGRPVGPAEAYLSRARLLGRLGRLEQAYGDLRQAVSWQRDYGLLSRAARLLARLKRQAEPPSVRSVRLALLSGSTIDLLAPLLDLACFRDGVKAELYIAPYGNYQQEVLDPASGLYEFAPDIVLVATHWRDAGLPSLSEKAQDDVDSVVGRFHSLWQTVLGRCQCRIVQHSFDLPGSDALGHLGGALPGGRAHMLRTINRRLRELAPDSVAVLDLESVARECGLQVWEAPSYWHLAKQHPAPDALGVLVDHQTALIRAALGLTRKVLVLDLDNTLWGGVIGEDGLEGIAVGPPSAAGEAHHALQQYALGLKERGIVLAVCSKNNETDARLPFDKHDQMALHSDDFAVFRANWLDKPANLRDIAATLNVGIDSLVLLDDNPAERALVRQELPQVLVPEPDGGPETFIGAIESTLCFEAWSLSEEDRQRHGQYRANAEREELATSAGTLDEFLAGLDMEAEAGPFDETVLARVVQLLGKTNQFNLTTRRHGEEQVRDMMASEDWWTQWFKLSDRFGDNGLIGVMIARRLGDEAASWQIDTWLMSCRVIGRQMERFMLKVLCEAAAAQGAGKVRGVYIPTPRNEMVAHLYRDLGFEPVDGAPGVEQHYELDLTACGPVQCEFIGRRQSSS